MMNLYYFCTIGMMVCTLVLFGIFIFDLIKDFKNRKR